MNDDGPRVLATEDFPGTLDTVSWDYRQVITYAQTHSCPTEARRLLAKRRAVYRKALDLVLAQAEWALGVRPAVRKDAEPGGER